VRAWLASIRQARAIADNLAMHRLRHSRWTHWIGVFLVLLPLLAPTISHALRHAGAVRSLPWAASVACLPGAVGASASSASVSTADDSALHAGTGDAALHACAYCACPAFGHTMPVTAAGDVQASSRTEPIAGRFDLRPARSTPERPRARSPPEFA
jgi:hypothetical protein